MKTMFLRPFVIAAILGVFAIAVSAQKATVYKHAAGGIQFTAPAKWKAVPDGDILTVSSPDETVSVMFFVADSEDFVAATEGVIDELGKIIKNIEISSDGKDGSVNGLESFTIDGSGTVDDVEIVWHLALINALKPTMVLTIGAADFLEQHIKDYRSMVNSIKRVK